MANYVLVHGAWHGGWCWRDVVKDLAGAGNAVHAVTLTGLGERSHLMSPLVTLEMHIADVAGTIEANELDDVVLAVHSYAGMIGTAVADRMPDRIRHLVYVDAVVPKPGESWSSTQSSATREARLAAAQASPDYSLPAPGPEAFALTGEAAEWYRRRATPHPGHTYQAPLDFDPQRVAGVARTFVDCNQPALATIDAIRARVRDAAFWDGAWTGGAGARIVEMATGHDPMITRPAELASLLRECAR
jgi:pimeloyl-ACP methyl ester carboxylesterase